MTVSKHAIGGYVKAGKLGAKSLARIKEKNDRLLIVILIGNNLVNVGASALATVGALKIAESLRLPGEYGIALATGAVTLILLFFGEITPKSIASKYAGAVALAVAPAYEFLMTVLLPLTVVIEWFIRGIHKLFRTHSDGQKMSAEELEAFLEISHESGAVETHEHKKIRGILDLSETEAASVMTPRVKVEFVGFDATVDEAVETLLAASHSRLPVSGKDTDDVDYVVTLREVVGWQKAGLGSARLNQLELEKIIKIPLTKPLDQLFETFQKSRKHIALVMDEYGGVAGVVTLEDVVEEVFGDIKDEKDREEVYVRRMGDGSVRVKGDVTVEDAFEPFGRVDLASLGIDEYENETVSYLVISLLGAFPNQGETIRLSPSDDGCTFELTVEGIDDNAVTDVRLIRTCEPENGRSNR